MKKLMVIAMILIVASVSFAAHPVNYTAKLLPQKGMLISGGTSTNIGAFTTEFTYGFSKANIHAKINYLGTRFNLEGLMQHHLFEWNSIDMGFSYGGHVLFGGAMLEIGAIAMWNMSYPLASNVSFLGGFKYKIGYGISWGTGYFINRLVAYLGTEIEIIENLKLYIELQPTILNTDGRMLGVNGSFIGVNYYFPIKSAALDIPDA